MNIFFIGLGGTGSEIANTLLSRSKEQIRVPNFEYLLIDFPEPLREFASPEISERNCFMLERPPKEWFAKKFPDFPVQFAFSDFTDTKRVRALGKIVYEFNKENIRRKTEELATNFARNTQDHSITFWLLTALGGGIGSGMLLDVAVMLDDVRKSMIQEGFSISLVGMGIIPSISWAGVCALSTINAIASFKELEYLISGGAENELGITNPFNAFFILDLQRPVWSEPQLVYN